MPDGMRGRHERSVTFVLGGYCYRRARRAAALRGRPQIMASYNMNQVRTGLKVLQSGEPNVLISCDFIKPGKGQAFTRVKMRNLLSGRVNEKTLKPGDLLHGADVVDTSMQYLYSDGQHWFFMDPETFDQVEADAQTLAGAEQWIKEEDVCNVTLWNGHPIQIKPPNFVIREVVETDPGLKGDTSSGGSKPARLETGATVKVPLFIQNGESIRVDTRTGEYVSRART